MRVHLSHVCTEERVYRNLPRDRAPVPSCTDPSAEHSSHAKQPLPGYVWCRAFPGYGTGRISHWKLPSLQLEEGASLGAPGPAAPPRHNVPREGPVKESGMALLGRVSQLCMEANDLLGRTGLSLEWGALLGCALPLPSRLPVPSVWVHLLE